MIVPGELVQLHPLVRRLTAPNPGMMTGPGTNSYIVGREALAVIDPGPESDAHGAALLAAAGGRLRWILCTHTHIDHSPGARALQAATGAQVLGYGTVPRDGRQDAAFHPERALADGDVLGAPEFRLRALYTPGHASNHLCYLLEGEGLLFTGDHVMQGSTVVISPPDGDMIVYLRSLERLSTLELSAFAPGHGRLITTPRDEVRRLIAHRLQRERKVLAALAAKQPATLEELVPVAYDDVPERVHPVARRSLHAHLLKLAHEGRARDAAGAWSLAA
ncbi:MAG: MBL fold metallo-hydrolase [Burkholderiales bacterium]|nr:MBL fold metallo-hydrolase [Burkholderiales bacterium]